MSASSPSPPVPESVALDLADQGIHLKPGWLADCAHHLRVEHGPARWARMGGAARRARVYAQFLRCDLRVAGASGGGALRRARAVAAMGHGEALREGERCAVQLDEVRCARERPRLPASRSSTRPASRARCCSSNCPLRRMTPAAKVPKPKRARAPRARPRTWTRR